MLTQLMHLQASALLQIKDIIWMDRVRILTPDHTLLCNAILLKKLTFTTSQQLFQKSSPSNYIAIHDRVIT